MPSIQQHNVAAARRSGDDSSSDSSDDMPVFDVRKIRQLGQFQVSGLQVSGDMDDMLLEDLDLDDPILFPQHKTTSPPSAEEEEEEETADQSQQEEDESKGDDEESESDMRNFKGKDLAAMDNGDSVQVSKGKDLAAMPSGDTVPVKKGKDFAAMASGHAVEVSKGKDSSVQISKGKDLSAMASRDSVQQVSKGKDVSAMTSGGSIQVISKGKDLSAMVSRRRSNSDTSMANNHLDAAQMARSALLQDGAHATAGMPPSDQRPTATTVPSPAPSPSHKVLPTQNAQVLPSDTTMASLDAAHMARAALLQDSARAAAGMPSLDRRPTANTVPSPAPSPPQKVIPPENAQLPPTTTKTTQAPKQPQVRASSTAATTVATTHLSEAVLARVPITSSVGNSSENYSDNTGGVLFEP